MSQLYYPLEPNQFNSTEISDYTTNLQNIYYNIENVIKKNTKVEKLVVLKDELYKELTSDNEELFHEVIKELLEEKKLEYLDAEESTEDINNNNNNDDDEEVEVEDDVEEVDEEMIKEVVKEECINKNIVQDFRFSLNNFKNEFLRLQEKFLDIDKKLKKETEKTDKDINILEKMINFVNNFDDSYNDLEEIKNINDNINSLSDKIKTNNELKHAKRDYVKIRVRLNDCFTIIKSLNNLNISNTCSLCLTNKVQEFIDPCGHCFCTSCKERLIHFEGGINDASCPSCRGFIRDFKPLYL